MLSSKIISLITFLVVIIAVVLSVTSAPVAAPASVDELNDNQTALQSDVIAVSSDGNDIKVYSEDDAKKIDDDILENGNSAEGDGKGLKI